MLGNQSGAAAKYGKRKRIRLNQARLGMFVEELEAGKPNQATAGFMISSPEDVERVLRSKVISLVINTAKGVDVLNTGRPAGTYDPRKFDAELFARHSQEEIREAKETIKETTPLIRELFSEARLSGTVQIGDARAAADQIISTAQNSSAAMIGITRLKNKDEYTFLHSLAVSALMVSFGRALALDEETVSTLALSGLVHDIGKVTLPRAILTKTGKLTDREFATVKTHPARGTELLAHYQDLPTAVFDVCLHHHERFDGTGYPHGLAGEKIPFVARLAAICDVYEAMTTIRPYKEAWTQAQTIDLMLRSSGHFDPALLGAFVSKMVISGVIS
jgi:HD-GYP domain-containing protein (c-di-GMP phosphodiesterase class II)